MSSSGGGSIILHAYDQRVWVNFDLTKTLTLSNDTGGEVDLTYDECVALAAEFCPDPYSTVALAWTVTAWTVTDGPS